ncbi:unnamed protein product [Hermetia illucens]|uniref:Tetraspanin n=1 Tax=Hermetia illucens TaxID=343691 RepID=A0A7R8UJV2_HERIL|nr:tetraspanin-18 [Hermetia illucens]XP_037905204.1 tetraspanin-18 [Hermetia illucens]XP_037905205.1 tetraspanin-18 [Hermetia illucens]CAD7081998.1 unnamed protein product [Hermetia illucens]
MASDCGVWIAKYLLCLFNFIFFLLGTVVLGAGIWLAVDKSSLIALLKMVESEHLENFTQPRIIEDLAYVLIACGAVMFLLSFLGYCGALQESTCLLTTYGILMILILLAELTVGGLAIGYKTRTKDETMKFLQSTITRYYSYSTSNQTDVVTAAWNEIMIDLNCCGVQNYKDFESSPAWNANKGNRTVPETCCILENGMLKDPNCPNTPTDANSYMNKGCFEAMVEWLINHQNIIIIVGVGIALVELIIIFLAFCLCKAIDKYRGMRL